MSQPQSVQQAYEQIALYFSLEGARLARNVHTGECWYRGPDGSMCPVGVLIDDDEYLAWLEGDGAEEVFERMGWHMDVDTEEFLLAAQRLHDTVATVAEFRVGLGALKTAFDAQPGTGEEMRIERIEREAAEQAEWLRRQQE